MTDPLDDLTRRVPRSADPDDETRLAGHRTPDDETLIADRRTDEGTRVTERRVARHAPSTAIAHGRADTPRTASAPGVRVSQSVYVPRTAAAAPPVRRAPVPPPAATPRAPRRRARRGGIAVAALAGAVVVAGAAWGIFVIFQGGM